MKENKEETQTERSLRLLDEYFATASKEEIQSVVDKVNAMFPDKEEKEGVGQKEAFTLEDMKAAFEAGRVADSWSNEIGWITHHTFDEWIKTRK